MDKLDQLYICAKNTIQETTLQETINNYFIGSLDAKFELATMIIVNSVEQDKVDNYLNIAMVMMLELAENDYVQAQCSLAVMYAVGYYIPIDYEKSKYWMRRAKLLDFPIELYNLDAIGLIILKHTIE